MSATNPYFWVPVLLCLWFAIAFTLVGAYLVYVGWSDRSSCPSPERPIQARSGTAGPDPERPPSARGSKPRLSVAAGTTGPGGGVGAPVAHLFNDDAGRAVTRTGA